MTPAVSVRTLGGFYVVRDGEPVPLSEWQSKKARALLKILVARRGRPTPRDLLALATAGRPEAVDRLAAAEAAYTGDFLEEDLYEDWAEPLREEARAVYVQVLRVLSAAADARGDYDASTRYLLRVLERDPYDEPANLALVGSLAAAGRHGEARRFYRAYGGRMLEIGIEPAPFAA